MSDIVLYTTNCPKCKEIEKRLNNKNIKYEKCEDIDAMIELGYQSAPILKVDDNFLDFKNAIYFIKNVEN